MAIQGQLIQPRLLVKWGSTELSVDLERPDYSPIIGASMQFQDAESFPTCGLSFSSDIIGYEAYRKCINEHPDEPIVITVGYPAGSWFSAKFYYTGVTLSSGNSGQITITGSSKQKDFLSSFNTSLSVDSTLEEMTQTIQRNISTEVESSDVVEFEFVGDAESVGQTQMNGVVARGVTAGRAITQHVENQGGQIDLSATADVNQPRARVRVSPLFERETGNNQPTEKSTNQLLSLGDESYGFLVGPGLLRDFNRTFNYNPSSNTPPSARASRGNANSPGGFGSDSPQDTVTEDSNKPLQFSLREARENQNKFVCSTSFFMVPQVVGIKPRDFLFVPSLTEDYLEDWVVESVGYDFTSAGAQINVSGFRVDLDPGQKMVSTDTYHSFLERSKSFQKLEDWEKYYWAT